MGIQVSLSSADNPYRLDGKYREILIDEVLMAMWKKLDITDPDELTAWAEANSVRIEKMIDSPDNEPIRMLARLGDYQSARDAVIVLL